MTHRILAAALAAPFLAAGIAAQKAQDTDGSTLVLKDAEFDPTVGEPGVPAVLRGADDTELWIVQFVAPPDDAMRAALRETGGEIVGFVPHDAYTVRMSHARGAEVRTLPAVRWVGYYHPAYRVEPLLYAEITNGEDLPERRYNVVVADKHTDKPGLIAKIKAIGGTVTHEQPGSILLEVQLTGPQLVQAARFDEVLWIDRWTPSENDMDNARIQGGANYVETVGGYTGLGIKGHLYEGIEATHPDFTNTPIVVPASCSAPDNHGHCTSGIVFGNGTSNPGARGMAPDAQAYYTNNTGCATSRWSVIDQLVNTHNVLFTTASWGGSLTTAYTSTSASTDDIIFDHDIVWTNSQSNAGTQQSRPEAWAKNVFSIGGVDHFDNSNPGDDSWNAGNGSTGPAADGRIKPDLCAYYDSILCSDRVGAEGYNTTGDFNTGFGGTSGATPICAGHNALALQMYTDGLFGPLRVPGGTRFQNRPHAATLKALQIACATQYPFTSGSTDNRREHQGWGFPGLRAMWDDRAVIEVIDETDAITQGQTNRYTLQVAPGRPELKIAMCFSDPAGNPAASLARINDLTLRVTSPSGTVYWGNTGLSSGNYSTAGGVANTVDTVECVLVQNPAAGTWIIDVVGSTIAVDARIESPAVDADFGLVVRGGTALAPGGNPGTFAAFGSSCQGSPTTGPGTCASWNDAGTTVVQLRNNVNYALEFVAPSALTILGFEIVGNTNTGGAQSLVAGIWTPNGSGVPTTQIATGTMPVTATTGTCRATLTAPLALTAGQTYFAWFQNLATGIDMGDNAGTGTTLPYYRFEAGAWSARLTSREWLLRVICQTTVPNSPSITANGLPDIGSGYTVDLANALPGATGGVITGFSNTTWAGGALPQPLSIIGGGTCTLFVATDFNALFTVTPTGTGSFTLGLPSQVGIIGVHVFHQGFVFDVGANALGLALTGAIDTTIGG